MPISASSRFEGNSAFKKIRQVSSPCKNYKSRVCAHFAKSGECEWADECGFAHGKKEFNPKQCYAEECDCEKWHPEAEERHECYDRVVATFHPRVESVEKPVEKPVVPVVEEKDDVLEAIQESVINVIGDEPPIPELPLGMFCQHSFYTWSPVFFYQEEDNLDEREIDDLVWEDALREFQEQDYHLRTIVVDDEDCPDF